jgi:hypothetical protein
MTISYEWRFDTIEVSTASDPEDAAQVLHWRLIATDDADGVSSDVYGSVTLGSPDPDDFIEFDDITNANCVDWTVAAMTGDVTEDSLKAALAAQIIAQRNPPRVSKRPSGWSR